jgi:hypothetical protein
MKVLLDECVPWPLHRGLAGHDCTTAQRQGWSAVKNGELLRLAEEAGFDLFVTSDQGIRYQQNLAGRRIAILELSTNDLRRLQLSLPVIVNEMMTLRSGEYRHLAIP